MNISKKNLFLIKIAYWLGIGADALWTVGLLNTQVFGILTGNPDFDPDLQVKLIMGIGGSLMLGWTLLLLWAVRKPIERRVVILLTAFPVVTGIFVVTLLGYLNGGTPIWLLIKTIILIVSMVTSYFLASRIDRENASVI